ncbi:hypothetical protein FHS85_002765 [Rhodoligotrophos appendicifer]|uniref:hypothetical protein n=1 Tax=Rhodoligotrophos appendicifer TaxID=987056 RepID=UPI001185E2C3|nr:hypothetical protein [Rhodoligotrophos appendicifer]
MIGWLCLALLLLIGGVVLIGTDLLSLLPIDTDSIYAELGTTIALLVALLFIEIFNRQGKDSLLRALNSVLAAIIALASLAIVADDITEAVKATLAVGSLERIGSSGPAGFTLTLES